MVFSLEDFDTLPFSSNIQQTPPISPANFIDNPSNPPTNTEVTEGSTSRQDSSLPTHALDPVLLALSPAAPNLSTSPILQTEDLTQFARHLTLQKGLSKPSADELMGFAKVFLPTRSPFLLPSSKHSNLSENSSSGSLHPNSH